MGPHPLLPEIAHALGSVFILVALGAVVRRAGWLSEDGEKGLVGLLVRVLLPALVVSALLAQPPPRAALFVGPGLGALLTLLAMALAGLVARLPARWTGLADVSERRTFTLGAGLGNYAYLAIPVATALYGADVLPTLLLFNLGVEVVLWTVGLQILPGDRGTRHPLLRLLNPPFVALAVGLTLGLADLGGSVPSVVLIAAQRLGQSAVPLGLVAVGAALGADLGRARLGPVLAAAGVRFALLPAATLLVVRAVPLDDALRHIAVIQSVMPAAMAPVMLARLYGGAPELASRITLGTSVLGLLAIPLLLTVLAPLAG